MTDKYHTVETISVYTFKVISTSYQLYYLLSIPSKGSILPTIIYIYLLPYDRSYTIHPDVRIDRRASSDPSL